MAVAPRAQPEQFFSTEEWQSLTARSRWRGLWLVAHAWGVIGLCMVAGARWPAAIPLLVLVVGARQLGLAILMHDAAHACLHADRRINDWVGYWLCSPNLKAYRPYHLQHHRFVQQTEDPDLVLSAPFPITRESMWRKAARDLTGQTFYKQRIQPLLKAWQQRAKNASTPSATAATSPVDTGLGLSRGTRFLLANGLGLAVFSAAGYWWVWVTLWLLPMMTWLPLISRVRNIAEHALVDQNEADPLRQARTTHASWLERAVLVPYWVNYHSEHHLFTQVPCWNLPKAHALLQARGVTGRMETQPGYLTVLRLATAA
jgi:fatty acid desaturase